MDDLKKITKYEKVEKFISNLANETLLIYSPTSLKKTIIDDKININLISTTELTKNVCILNEKIKEFPNNINLIIALGGGTAIDIGKYISYVMGKKLIAIPSMLSTNVYSTNKVALIVNENKMTLSAKMPDEIIVDCDFLAKSSKYNLYGLVDVFSIYTALYDWKIADNNNKEKIDSKIFNQANGLIEEALLFVKDKLPTEIEKNIEQIYKIVGNTGLITNIYGTGRPESGSEHIFAKEIEQHIKIHHGISVSISIIIMSLIQKHPSKEIYDTLLKIGVLNNLKEKGITRELLFKTLKGLKARYDRYSIVDVYSRDDMFINEILDEFDKIVSDDKNVNNQ